MVYGSQFRVVGFWLLEVVPVYCCCLLLLLLTLLLLPESPGALSGALMSPASAAKLGMQELSPLGREREASLLRLAL